MDIPSSQYRPALPAEQYPRNYQSIAFDSVDSAAVKVNMDIDFSAFGILVMFPATAATATINLIDI